MALEDAVVLAEELEPDRPLAEALAALSERRYPRARLVQDVSRGILNSEMQIKAENRAVALAHMREQLPGRAAQVDSFLNQPA
jgi:2-polyprenyl-6-methoxyphenol hydroxylase-like FAD-dependent oxidoreductase